MTGGQRQFARATAVLIVLALCWPMATALAAAASSPASPACCMRAAHGCHSHNNSGAKFESVCHTCGWCHALPNARAHLASAAIAFSFSVYRAPQLSESLSQAAAAPSRLHASRAPPRSAPATEAI
ncbi:MAG: hypothetical protein LAN70_05100 [Acidobacteriia bacterium]|nr:hypothetical protein [Terriglobia bacterium]